MELKKYRLEELATVEISGVDKKTKDNEIPVKLCNFTDVYYNWAITKEMADSFMEASANQKEIDSFSLKKGQVAFTKDSETRDDIGVPTYIADDFENVVLGYHTALVTPDKNKLSGKYLNAFMNSKYIQKYFENNASGSGQRYTLSNETLNGIPVLAPDLPTQEKIGDIFSNIDRKIALNRRMNAKLEQMAKRLYDHWFVQFDFPNAAGKPYKTSGGKMVWNEKLKRDIPDGWAVKNLGDICDIVLGGTPSTSNEDFWINGTINWLNSGEVAVFPIIKSEKKITELAIQESSTQLLKAGSVTLSITRYLRPSILAMDACINQSVVGIKENESFKNCFLYPYLQNEIERLMSLRTGAQQPHINKEIVADSVISVPPKELMDEYVAKANPIYSQIINIAKENERLTTLREHLLPLLMNGQVEVK